MLGEDFGGGLGEHRKGHLLGYFGAGHKGVRQNLLKSQSFGSLNHEDLGNQRFRSLRDWDILVEGVLTLLYALVGLLDVGSLKGRASVEQRVHDDPQGPNICLVGVPQIADDFGS